MDKIVVLDAATLSDDIAFRPPAFEHEWVSYSQTKAEQVLKRAIDANYLITNKVVLDKNTLSQLPSLKHVAIAATGTNCVDLDAAKALGVGVSNVPGYGTTSVAEHVFSMILGLRRALLPYQYDISKGKWQAAEQFCFYNQRISDISGSILGIIGTGAIALELAKLAEAFNMKVLFHSVSGRKSLENHTLVGLTELLRRADVVSIHCPLTESSTGLINEDTLGIMKKDALLINTARGSIVDLDALYKTLVSERLAGAGIDVAPQEPPEINAPIMRLNNLTNCIVTPHTAWASQQARARLVETIIQNIEASHANISMNLV